ncbi:MAG: HlyD family secretion protein, partial [Gammaproteobacteria bacterium]
MLVSPLAFKVFSLFAAVIIIAIGCLLYWGTYTNKQTVVGYILPSKGVVTVYAPQFGTVVARYVNLGER